MNQFNFADFTQFSLDDQQLTGDGPSPFPARTLEQVVDPALLLVDPTESSRDDSSSFASLSRFGSAEGGLATFAATGNASPAGSKSPLQLGVDFIKNFGSERKITRGTAVTASNERRLLIMSKTDSQQSVVVPSQIRNLH
jgi:hypothetical protein